MLQNAYQSFYITGLQHIRFSAQLLLFQTVHKMAAQESIPLTNSNHTLLFIYFKISPRFFVRE